MNTKNNSRSRKTRERLKEALLRLLARRDILDVTVSRLCQEAGVNRSTFYAHYQDIYDLLTKIEEDMLEDWATPVNFGSDASHKGLGRFLIKLGGLPGIPINVEMCPLEKSGFNDTNLKWHA